MAANKPNSGCSLSASCANSVRPLRWRPGIGWQTISNAQFVQLLRIRFGTPTVLPIGGWRCDYCRPRGRPEVNEALNFDRMEEMEHGDGMHGVSLEKEPFHGLCCVETGTDHLEARCDSRFARTHVACAGVTVVSTEPTLEGEGGHG